MLGQQDFNELPREEYGFPGPLRDRLVAAILSGAKTSTTSLLCEYALNQAALEPLPRVGDRGVVVDSQERPVAVTTVTRVRVVPLGSVDLAHAVAEGEGHRTLNEWRRDHEEFWHSDQFREHVGDPHFTVTDATPTVLVEFAAETWRDIPHTRIGAGPGSITRPTAGGDPGRE